MTEGSKPELESDIADATEVSRRRMVLNAASNYANLGLSLMLMLFLQAFLVRQLGRDEYALWPLAETCVGFLALIPLGVGSGAGRFLAHALASKNLRQVEQITTSLFFSMFVAAVVYAAGSGLVALYFEQIFDIPEGASGIGPWVMLFVGLAGAVAMPFGVFEGGLVATQRFVALNVIRVSVIALRVALVVAIFHVGYRGLVWLAVVNFVLAVGHGCAVWWYARRRVPWQRVRIASFNWPILRKVTNYSGLTLLIALAGLLYWKTDNVVINKLLDPSLLTAYAVIVSFILGVYQLVSRGTGVLMPAMTVLYAQRDTARIARLIYRINRVVVPIAVPCFVYLALFGEEILRLYVGPQYAEYASVFPILALSGIVSCTQATSSSVPQAMGRLGVVAIASATWALVNVLLSVVFVLYFGWKLEGVAAGTTVAICLGRGGWTPFYIAYLLRLKVREVYRNQILVPLVHSCPIAIVTSLLWVTGWGQGWVGLGLILLFILSLQTVYMVLFALDKRDRQSVLAVLGRVRDGLSGGSSG